MREETDKNWATIFTSGAIERVRFFFSNEGLVEDFCGGGGDNNDNKKHFSLIECTKFARIIKNRKDETEMRRRWVQSSFVRN